MCFQNFGRTFYAANVQGGYTTSKNTINMTRDATIDIYSDIAASLSAFTLVWPDENKTCVPAFFKVVNNNIFNVGGGDIKQAIIN